MTTQEAFAQMTKLAPYFAAILDDADAADFVNTVRESKGDLPAGDSMKALMPLFADKHKDDVFNIVAITSEKTVEEVQQQPIMQTVRSLQSALMQESILFFMTCMQLIRNI